MRYAVLARHAQSMLNLERRVNGDPTLDVPLTERGEEEARALGRQLAGLELDVCIHTRFPRTRLTAELAVAGRDVPLAVEPLFDDIAIGELDGASIDDYRAWKHSHPRNVPFPGGESLDDAARRYAAGFRRLLESPFEAMLVVCHEIPIRYALNGLAWSDQLDGPAHEVGNAVPYFFTADLLARGADGIERLVGTVRAT
jgi:broad specificity phosphatase PhoE